MSSLSSKSSNPSSTLTSLTKLGQSASSSPPSPPAPSSEKKKKIAWGGAAEKQIHVAGKLVQSDGSIMPKPGEVPFPKGGKKVPSTELNTAKSSSGWDSRERGKASKPVHFVPKSSIQAAAAAAKASKAASVVFKSTPHSASSAASTGSAPPQLTSPLSSQRDSTATSKGFRVDGGKEITRIEGSVSASVAMSSHPLSRAAVMNKVSAQQSQESSQLSKKSTGNGLAKKHVGSIDSVVDSTSASNRHSSESNARYVDTPFGSSRGAERAQWRAPASSSSSTTKASATTTATASTSSTTSTSSPKPGFSQPTRSMGRGGNVPSQQRRSLFGSARSSVAQANEGPGNSYRDSLSRLKIELEKEREQKRLYAVEVQSLKAANASLQDKLNLQEKELSMLKREMHRMKLMQSTTVSGTSMNAASSPSSGVSVVPSTSSDAARHGGVFEFSSTQHEEEDSPLLRRLYGASNVESYAPPQSLRTVETLVETLITETLDRSVTQRVWSEAYPANENTILAVEYQDVMPRPQDSFEDAIDNSDMPFIPKLRRKPNSIEPLNHQELMSEPWRSPYRKEILNVRYHGWQLGRPEVIREIRGLNSCNLYYVDQVYQMNDMIQRLSEPNVRELAIDTEHHALRSYQGFLCLMQISTRFDDFIVDVLALRSHLHALQPLFTNPNVVKVFHGADMDIVWLQRDLGLYVVNMFDTGQAARELGYPSFSFSYLLARYTGIQPNKTHQTSDWRIRPLPREMIDYARQDTHFLLDIYDRLRLDLIDTDRSLVEKVLHRSAQVASQAFVKSHLDKEVITAQMLQLTRKHRVRLQCVPQRDVFVALAFWRDRVARIRDESVQYIMDDLVLLALARDCPTSFKALQRSLRRLSQPIPPLVSALRGSLFWEIASVLDPPVASIKSSPSSANRTGMHASTSDRSVATPNGSHQPISSPSRVALRPGSTVAPALVGGGPGSTDRTIGFGWFGQSST